MIPPGYRLVILDLDGTLVDSAPDLCTALALTLAEVGLPPHDLPAVRRMIGEGQRALVERALVAAGGDASQVDEVLPRFRRNYGANLVRETVCYEGVRETLVALAEVMPLAVATNKPGAWAREICERLGLAPSLRLTLGEDDVGRRKPDPLILHEICARLGVLPEAALFVGDSAVDLRTAENAGVHLVFAAYGYADEWTRALLAGPARPQHVVSVIDAFPALERVVSHERPAKMEIL